MTTSPTYLSTFEKMRRNRQKSEDRAAKNGDPFGFIRTTTRADGYRRPIPPSGWPIA